MSAAADLIASQDGAADGSRVLTAVRGVRGEVLMHALAQLPDDVTLRLAAAGQARRRLQRLADAYGIADRVYLGGDCSVADVGEPRTFAELLELVCPNAGAASCRDDDDALLAGHRVAVVTNVPMHYRVALFNELAQRLGRVGAELRVLFLAPGDPARTWLSSETPVEFEHELVRVAFGRGVPAVPRDLGSLLRRFLPSILLVGGFSPFVGAAAYRYASRAGIPFGIWSGEVAGSSTAESGLRRRQRRLLVSRADFAIAYGHAAGEYLHSLAPRLPLVYGRNSTPIAERTPRADRDVVEVLTVGRAVPRKGLDTAVDAFARLSDLPCRLTVVGGGPELAALERRAEGNPVVRFLGPLPADEVRNLYRDADLFLFPSRSDVFGLVLVEAMGAGLPAVVSTSVGAVDDLAVPDRNCLVVETDDADAWAAAIRRLVGEPMLRRSLGERAAATIRNRWTIEHAADAMAAGLRLAVLEGPR